MEATLTKKHTEKYIETVGRRKTAIARVRIYEASKTSFSINDREMENYFPTNQLQIIVKDAFAKVKLPVKFKVTARITGGGINAQAEALRHGIARALIAYDQTLRKEIKPLGFLKRDPRAKERRKFGLKKARKSPQWSKR
ncbi:MAG TPA: 30S ribosomal protein S9 [Candidatus Nanoarchaeia archaeon]|nr:30S ribosomal protein S9 [Candidatus Nanoarchaeia archaeon]